MKILDANLPSKLSDVILIALEDLEKAEKSKEYEIDMDDWYKPNGVCKVCFAGAVMAQSEGLGKGLSFKFTLSQDRTVEQIIFRPFFNGSVG